MSPMLLWNNLLAYSAQLLALVAIGALLPLVFRLRNPRAHLIYCQLLLVASLALPALEPWAKPLLIVPDSSAASVSQDAPRAPGPPATPRFPWEQAALMVIGAGAVARALWLLAGFWRLRRYRTEATPLYPLPEAIEAARLRTGADAIVCLSEEVSGPVTFGVLHPVVLLPPAVLDQPSEALFGIACHELLHVRRRDWLLTVCEELVGVLLWFHPAVWWLLGQIRLAREQVVDLAVVSCTQAREPYIKALLEMGGARPQFDLAPAALFLRKRHLANRIHSLLKEVTVSKRRLVSSYISIAAMLMLTAWFVVASFPLQGSPQVEIQQGAVTDAPGVSVETGGRILHRTSVRYPAEAITKGVQGMVVIEATLDSTGIVSDVRVLSGPEELRRSALDSVLQWHYVKDASTPPRLQATIDFRLPPPSAVPVPPTPSPAATPSPDIKYVVGGLDVYYLPEPLQDAMRSRLTPFIGQPFSIELRDKITAAVREVDLHARARPGFRPGPEKGIVLVEFQITLDASAPIPLPPPAPPAPPAAGVQRVSIGGAVQSSKLLHLMRADYPPKAREARVQGMVRFTAVIGVDGKILNLTLVSGHPLLASAAQEAVRQWVYQPTLLNGQPVEVVTQIDVNFTLQ